MKKQFVSAKQAQKWGWIESKPTFYQRLLLKIKKIITAKKEISYCDCCGCASINLICSGWGCLCPTCRKSPIDCREWGIEYHE